MAINVDIPSPLRVPITISALQTLIIDEEVKPVWYMIEDSDEGLIYVVGDTSTTLRKTAIRENSATNEYEYGTYDLDTDTFTAQGGGSGGQVDSVVGTIDQIEVDNTDPVNPILSLATAVTNSLAKADTALQPGDNISELTNDAGYITGHQIEVTKSELDDLINDNDLEKGALYKITGVDTDLYGGTTIWLRALSNNQLSPDGWGLFYTPKYNNAVAGREIFNPTSEWTLSSVTGDFEYEEPVTADNGATGMLYGKTLTKFVPLTGDWTTATSITGDFSGATANIDSVTLASFSIGQKVHWGGKTWENVNGKIGVAIDIYTLDSEWLEIPYNDIDYNLRLDVIKYNIAEDYICYREDLAGNKVEKTTKVPLIGRPDPIKSFQWGNEFDVSAVYGVGNITVRGLSCCENINFRGSFQRNLTFDNNSFQSNLTFDNGSYQSNLTFDNGSFQFNLTFDNGSSQSYLTFDSLSYQDYLTFDNGSSQSYLTFNNSYQSNFTFDNGSSQNNLTFDNGSYQRYLTLDNGSSQSNLTFDNSSYQSNLTFDNSSSQSNLTFDNSSSQSNLTAIAGEAQLYNTFEAGVNNFTFGNNLQYVTIRQGTVGIDLTDPQFNFIYNNTFPATIYRGEDGELYWETDTQKVQLT